jgi:hypothetical protein
MMERVNDVGSGMALTAPLWLPTLQQGVSVGLGLMGIAWIAMQMYYKVRNGGR